MPLSAARVLLHPPKKWALGFDGVDDYVEVPHSESYALTRHSVELLVYIPQDTEHKLVFSKGWRAYYRCLIESYRYFRITRMDATNFIWKASSGSWWLGWKHIYWYLDEYDENEKDLWINGVQYTPSYTIDPTYPLAFEADNPLRIMGDPGGAFVKGYLAFIRI